jgi:hypothetical protein
MTAPFVLSIDWDYFVGDSSIQPCKVCRWSCLLNTHRDASIRDRQRHELAPDPRVVFDVFRSAVMEQFRWDHWKRVPLVVADCHASIYRLLPRHSVIYNIDHHPDADASTWGFNPSDFLALTCGSWGDLAVFKKDCSYQWCSSFGLAKDPVSKTGSRCLPRNATPVLASCKQRYIQPDFIFFCLSSPYTNPKYDDYFYKAIYDILRESSSTDLRFVGLGSRELRRAYHRWEKTAQTRNRT